MADFTNKTENTPDDWEQQARTLRDQQKWDDVISLSSSVIPTLKTGAEKAVAYLMRGYAYNEKGEYDSAITDFSKTIELKPDYVAAYHNRGCAYNEKGKYDLAIADFNKAIELKSDYATAYHNRGYAYNEKGKYDFAIADFNKAIELQPNDAVTYHNRGRVYNRKGEHDLAIADFNKAIELQPDYATAYNNRGYAYTQKGEHDLASADYSHTIALKPDNATAYNNRGYTYNEKGEHDLAIADFNKAIELKPDNATAYHNRGKVYNRKGEYDSAIADFNKAIELKPDYAMAYYFRGYAYAKKGKDDKMLADWEKAIKLAPNNAAIQDSIFTEIKSAEWLHKQISEELKSAKGFEGREEEHKKAQARAGNWANGLLGVLFVFYAGAFVLLAYCFGLFDCCKANAPDASEILPWIPVIFLTSSPIIWASRILNREKTRHFALRENAYANKLMALLIYDTPEKERAELVKKLFDHHSLRGSPRLVIDLENKPKTDDSVVWQLLNLVRRGGGKPGDNK